MTSPDAVMGVLLAGGQSLRMGAPDKMLQTAAGKTLLAWVIERIGPQVSGLVLNANGPAQRFDTYGLPVVADTVGGHAGPLAGILTGLEWIRDHHPHIEWMLSVPTDTPLLPPDLVARMLDQVRSSGADLACAVSGDMTHPVIGLWPVRLAAELRHALVDQDMRKIDAWTARYKVAHVDWPGGNADPFFNINTREDLVRLRLILDGTLPVDPPVRAGLPVSVVVERKDGTGPWGGCHWRPLQVLVDAPQVGPWHLLHQGQGGAHYLVQAPDLELHRSDLSSYRYNLGGADPRLYVALRPDGDQVRVVMVTAAPDEAQTLLENNEDIVEPVALPPGVEDWIVHFTAQHPADKPMRKRRRDTYDPAQAGFGQGRHGGGRGRRDP